MAKQNSIRHALQMKQRKDRKAKKAAEYSALAASGNNSKRKVGAVGNKPHLRTRDPACKNIGDLISNPQMIPSALRLYRAGQYTGRYKGMLRALTNQ